MKKTGEIGLEFLIDKLTRSIENIITGDSFPTEISLINSTDLKIVTKKKGWLFNWKTEFRKEERDVFKLTIVNNPFVRMQDFLSKGT